MMDAGSPIPPDNTEPLWDQARSNIERKQQLPPKEQRFLEQASNQASAVSTPERLAALLDRIAEAKARSTTRDDRPLASPDSDDQNHAWRLLTVRLSLSATS